MLGIAPNVVRSPVVRAVAACLLLVTLVHFVLTWSSATYHSSFDTARERVVDTIQRQRERFKHAAQDDKPGTVWYKGHSKPSTWKPTNWQLDLDNADLETTKATNDTRVNAAFVVLARNSDLWELLPSIRQVEDRFNKRYHYPWIFLNEQPFSEEFKRHTSGLTSGEAKYGLIPEEHWPPGNSMPDFVDETKAWELINEMGKKPIPYAGSLPYRKMCRYQSGYFWRHPLLDDIEYYWRVEPGIKFYCDIPFDPFAYMYEHRKKYAFVLSLYEYRDTIPGLWDTTKEFIKEHPEYLPKGNAMKWLSDNGGDDYNLCHFWSNFEIASLSLWRSEAYQAYFEHLDKSGGFFYERWGDAPVHSIGAALFLRKEEIHFFKEIGYYHVPFRHCPKPDVGLNCECDPGHQDNFATTTDVHRMRPITLLGSSSKRLISIVQSSSPSHLVRLSQHRMSSSGAAQTGPMQARIKDKLNQEFQPSQLVITNDSWKHRHHHAMQTHEDQDVVAGGETHFTVELVSDKFEGLRALQRHRLVNGALASEFDKGLHALAIKAMSTSEAAAKASE
ncbi:hypothetical protein OIO90_000084 [Microbotryomycetes sp. JL221]|nr:hypothetical protein OIO90_000084 [Microbotryomycetes sp. JL221]